MATLRLSYAELGAKLDLTAEAARSLARRRHWQRVVGNDGAAVVLVDEEQLARRPGGRPAGQPGGRPPGRPEQATGVNGLDHAQLWQRIAELEAQRDHMAGELLAVTSRAARAEGEGVALRDALADLSGRLDRATAELAEARRPWWQRLLGTR